eukprot:TRINITY_DN4281_c0_g1_i8.p1 TRINITY_DN4281_c0_g1~~TRINITY_DN4281_c0_g1_i8.p1  ORF type:complete len:271 (+),score=74.11 TRINITY_DN4281_c0_g1_i8:100-912(+)
MCIRDRIERVMKDSLTNEIDKIENTLRDFNQKLAGLQQIQDKRAMDDTIKSKEDEKKLEEEKQKQAEVLIDIRRNQELMAQTINTLSMNKSSDDHSQKRIILSRETIEPLNIYQQEKKAIMPEKNAPMLSEDIENPKIEDIKDVKLSSEIDNIEEEAKYVSEKRSAQVSRERELQAPKEGQASTLKEKDLVKTVKEEKLLEIPKGENPAETPRQIKSMETPIEERRKETERKERKMETPKEVMEISEAREVDDENKPEDFDNPKDSVTVL